MTSLFKVNLCFSLFLNLFFSNFSRATEAPKEPDWLWPQKLIESDIELSPHALSKKIVVAVIDTGIDTEHPLLKSHLWTNPGESGLDSQGRPKDSNGIDDDKNGFIDDIHGWDFSRNTAKLKDEHGHGTHVAGIISSVLSPQLPDAASPVDFEIMSLKYINKDSSPLATLENTARAIEYAVQMGAHVINYSGGGLRPNSRERLSIEKARSKGILFVAAAGNESSNSDASPYFPAGYKLSNILSVTAIDADGKILKSSNFGKRSVDISAPGKSILSSLPYKKFGTMTGTSQATAFATGAAVALMGTRPELKNPKEIIQQLVKTGRFSESLRDKTLSSSRINVKRSIYMHASHSRLEDINKINLIYLDSNFHSTNSSKPHLHSLTELLSPSVTKN